MRGKKPTTPPFSLRLTFEERAALEEAAGDTPLGAYIREVVLDSKRGVRRRSRGKRPVKDQKELAKLMAMLGNARLASNLNQLAHHANSGSLPVTPDTERALRQASADIRFMRLTLMRALGLMPSETEAP